GRAGRGNFRRFRRRAAPGNPRSARQAGREGQSESGVGQIALFRWDDHRGSSADSWRLRANGQTPLDLRSRLALPRNSKRVTPEFLKDLLRFVRFEPFQILSHEFGNVLELWDIGR